MSTMSPPPGLALSLSKRNRSAVALTEFGQLGDEVVQHSPSKGPKGGRWEGQGRHLQPGSLAAAFEGSCPAAAACCPGAPASPDAVAEPPAPSVATSSQPGSATSMAAALADLCLASRQSSASDLGDRARILAGLPPGLAAVHTRCSSLDDCGAAPDTLTSSSGDCSPQLIGAIRSFDTIVLRTLTPIKVRSRAPTEQPVTDAADLPPSPAAPCVEHLVSPFQRDGSAGMQLKMACRPGVLNARGSSGLGMAPGAYDPYNPAAAALAAEFRSPAKSSRGPSATATPSQWGSASYRSATYRSYVAQQALAQQKDDEPDFYVSVPGRARPLQRQGSAASGSGSATVAAALAAAQQQVQQHPPPQLEREQAAALAASDSSSAGSSPRPEPAPCDSPLAVQRSLGSGSLLRHPSLGSGSFGGMLQVQRSSASETSIHGFRGLFKNLVAASKS